LNLNCHDGAFRRQLTRHTQTNTDSGHLLNLFEIASLMHTSIAAGISKSTQEILRGAFVVSGIFWIVSRCSKWDTD